VTAHAPSAAEPLAEVTRSTAASLGTWPAASRALAPGEIVESRHLGHLVVTGDDGEVVHALGEPARLTFVRSTAKPFQATACLELLGATAEDLEGEEVALSWASHRAEPHHLATARRLAGRSGTDVDELTCPPARGEDDPAAPEARVQHNCSGKHGLFALVGRALGVPRDRLLDPAGPLQRPVLAVVEDALGPTAGLGTDGCGAPAPAVPLIALARGFAALAVEDRWARVREAGLAHPQLVGGTGRLESALLAAGVVAKVGAEGVFAAGWRTAEGGRRGLAVKAEDGAERAATVAAHALLVAAGVVAEEVWSPAPVLGGGVPVGRVRAALDTGPR
jgi:L-asparaginase II